MNDQALIAAVDLVGRTGAREVEIGFLHEDAERPEDAGWYATALYKGAKVTEEAAGPIEAATALAARLLAGAKCAHCGGLVALSDSGAFAYETATMADGTQWTVEEARKAGMCRWRCAGSRWVRGCESRRDRRKQAR